MRNVLSCLQSIGRPLTIGAPAQREMSISSALFVSLHKLLRDTASTMTNVNTSGECGTQQVFVFLDESGNFDFSERGTQYFILTAVITSEPWICAASVARLRYEFLARGLDDQLPFHASENSHGTRLRFIQSLCGSEHDCRVHSIYGRKALAYSSIQSDVAMYSVFAKAMGKYLLKSLASVSLPIVLVYDATLRGKKRSSFLAAVKAELNRIQLPYTITFSSASSEGNGQVADMYAWALGRSLEQGDHRYLKALPSAHSAFNLFTGVVHRSVKDDHPA